MCPPDQDSASPLQLEENLKKALTELILLFLLSQKNSYIGELTAQIHEKSNGILTIVFPYAAIYRLEHAGYIRESDKRIAPDGRRRQYLQITDSGRHYLQRLLATYGRFTKGVANILERGKTNDCVYKEI